MCNFTIRHAYTPSCDRHMKSSLLFSPCLIPFTLFILLPPSPSRKHNIPLSVFVSHTSFCLLEHHHPRAVTCPWSWSELTASLTLGMDQCRGPDLCLFTDLAALSWTSYLTFFWIRFLICQMKVTIIVPTSQGWQGPKPLKASHK